MTSSDRYPNDSSVMPAHRIGFSNVSLDEEALGDLHGVDSSTLGMPGLVPAQTPTLSIPLVRGTTSGAPIKGAPSAGTPFPLVEVRIRPTATRRVRQIYAVKLEGRHRRCPLHGRRPPGVIQ